MVPEPSRQDRAAGAHSGSRQALQAELSQADVGAADQRRERPDGSRRGDVRQGARRHGLPGRAAGSGQQPAQRLDSGIADGRHGVTSLQRQLVSEEGIDQRVEGGPVRSPREGQQRGAADLEVRVPEQLLQPLDCRCASHGAQRARRQQEIFFRAGAHPLVDPFRPDGAGRDLRPVEQSIDRQPAQLLVFAFEQLPREGDRLSLGGEQVAHGRPA